MSLSDRIRDDIKTAMRAGEKDRLTTLRMALSAVKQREIDERVQLDDGQVIAVVEKMIKQRREAEKQYRDAGRAELADKEAAEIVVLEVYLPEALDDDATAALIEAAIAGTQAESLRDMGKVMAHIKAAAAGQVDMAAVSAQVRARLNS